MSNVFIEPIHQRLSYWVFLFKHAGITPLFMFGLVLSQIRTEKLFSELKFQSITPASLTLMHTPEERSNQEEISLKPMEISTYRVQLTWAFVPRRSPERVGDRRGTSPTSGLCLKCRSLGTDRQEGKRKGRGLGRREGGREGRREVEKERQEK